MEAGKSPPMVIQEPNLEAGLRQPEGETQEPVKMPYGKSGFCFWNKGGRASRAREKPKDVLSEEVKA